MKGGSCGTTTTPDPADWTMDSVALAAGQTEVSASRWKRQEREVAALLGGKRVPNNGLGQNDVEHPYFAIQVKTFKAFPVWLRSKWEQTKRDALAAAKAPLLALCYAPGAGIKVERLIVVRAEDFGLLLELAHLHGVRFGELEAA
jgi:hypothetical protein